MTDSQNVQCERWVLTVHNFEQTINFDSLIDYFGKPEFKIRRAVCGRERTTDGPPHLQGYIEFDRSYRRSHVFKVFRTGHWERARGSATDNYKYCTKEGDFMVYGDFSFEVRNAPKMKAVSTHLMLRGLMIPSLVPQLKVSKDYADRYFFYERTSKYLTKLKSASDQFENWKSKKLTLWQYDALGKIMSQGPRDILWFADEQGNHGKTFLATYLTVLYKFQYLTGQIQSRDLPGILREDAKGYVMDVSRQGHSSFQYEPLEAIKNGLLVSGKYHGREVILETTPRVVVFSNYHPDYSKLSGDRWKVTVLQNVDMTPVVNPQERYPFVKPELLPVLNNEDFCTRQFITSTLNRLNAAQDDEETDEGEILRAFAGPSTTGLIQRPNSPRGSPRDSPRDSPRPHRPGNPNIVIADTPPPGPPTPAPVAPPVGQKSFVCRIHDSSIYRKGCPCTTKSSKTNAKSPPHSSQTTLDSWIGLVEVRHQQQEPSRPASPRQDPPLESTTRVAQKAQQRQEPSRPSSSRQDPPLKSTTRVAQPRKLTQREATPRQEPPQQNPSRQDCDTSQDIIMETSQEAQVSCSIRKSRMKRTFRGSLRSAAIHVKKLRMLDEIESAGSSDFE